MFESVKRWFKKPAPEPLFAELPVVESPRNTFWSEKEIEELANVKFSEWLSSEPALRDEAVVFGLSGIDPQEKLKLIEASFDEHIAPLEKEQELLSEEIAELNLKIGRIEEKAAYPISKRDTLQEWSPETVQWGFSAFATAGLGVLSVGLFYLVYQLMLPLYPENALYISMGVFLAGFYRVFDPKNELSFEWYSFLLPAAASFFVGVQAAEQVDLWKVAGVFFLLFAFFLLIPVQLKRHVEQFLTNTAKLFSASFVFLKKQFFLKKYVADAADFEQQIDAIRTEKWKIIPKLNQVETSMAKLLKQKEQYLRLFESEYKLARAYKNKLPQQ